MKLTSPYIESAENNYRFIQSNTTLPFQFRRHDNNYKLEVKSEKLCILSLRQ